MAARICVSLVFVTGISLATQAAAFDVARVSVGDGGAEAEGRSRNAAITADGRLVAFATRATNLSPQDTNPQLDLYEHDRDTGRTRLLTSSINILPSSGDSDEPDYDDSGALLVFQSSSNNLVPGDEGQTDVFLHERATGRTLALSRRPDGEVPNGSSSNPVISGNGLAVAFESSASDLVPDDTNNARDIFIHYLGLDETRLVSLTNDGGEIDGAAFEPEVSDDARFVSFASAATALTNLGAELSRVFVRDLIAGTTTMVGANLPDRGISDIHDQPRLSGDGRHLAFRRIRDGGGGAQTVFVADLDAGTVVNVTPRDVNAVVNVRAISRDGAKVLFDTIAPIVPGDDNGQADVHVYDEVTGETQRVSGAEPGDGGNGESRGLGLSPDGRFALFHSNATNLVPGDDNGLDDVFLNDLREFAVDAAITGSWYDQAQDGQGFILEYLDGGSLLFYWFTFRPGGGRDWIFGILDVDGTVAEGAAFQKSGGLFPPAFDPDDLDELAWGTVRFEFSGCDAGEVTWDSSRPGYGSGGFPVVRLTRIPGLDCR